MPQGYVDEAMRLFESVRLWGCMHDGEDLVFAFPEGVCFMGTLDQIPDEFICTPLTRQFVEDMAAIHPEATILMLQVVLERLGARRMRNAGDA